MKNLLDRDMYLLEGLRRDVASELRHTESASRHVDRFKNPHQAALTHIRAEDDTIS